MAKTNSTRTGDRPAAPFAIRDRRPPILPSDIRDVWRESGRALPLELNADFHLLDPAFHPAETHEFPDWILSVVEDTAADRKLLKDDKVLMSTAGGPRNLEDCDDSAFRLKSAASAYRQSKLASPLCVGVVGCRTAADEEHMINWIVSTDVVKPGNPPTVRYRLSFVDFRALVEARLAGWDFKGPPPPSFPNNPPRMLHLLATPKEASKFIQRPFLILA